MFKRSLGCLIPNAGDSFADKPEIAEKPDPFKSEKWPSANTEAEAAFADHLVADAIIDRLSSEAKKAIVAITRAKGIGRDSRRATQAIIRHDMAKTLREERRDAARVRAKADRLEMVARRIVERGGKMLPGTDPDRAAQIVACIEDYLPS